MQASIQPTILWDEIYKIIFADHHDPFTVLGAHEITVNKKPAIAVRAFFPEAKEVFLIDVEESSKEYPFTQIHPDGFYEAIFLEKKKVFPYKLKIKEHSGKSRVLYDPYSFLPVLTDYDIYLFGEGNLHRAYEKLGAHILTINNITGVHFAVWAPNARRVSVVGNFNCWDGRRHQMRTLGSSGIWEIFIPGLGEGELYKYELKSKEGIIFLKTDPFAFSTELRPKTASVTCELNKYKWKDEEWMKERKDRNSLESPISIYEVHLSSWMRVPEEGNRVLTYRELAHKLVKYVNDMGYTHIELLPIAEHPFDGSWGYQVSGYFAPTSRYGSPEDFMYFVDYCHQHNIGVILDWVPAHFPKDAHALARFDGSCLYEHLDPRKGEHQDWGTLIFNYGRNEVRNFLITNALYWFDKFHIDGLRIDAVASMLYLDYSRKPGEWIPNEYGGNENLEAIDFLKRLNQTVYSYYPDIMMIAEESTAWPQVSAPTYLGGLGFGFKWNMGWMNDTLEYMRKDPVYRKYHQGALTFALLYAFHENFILPLSHDEVVHGKGSLLNKMPGDMWQKFANLRLLLGFMFGHPGKKLLFMGGDFGQWNEWNHAHSLDWQLLQYEPHQKLQRFVKDLNYLYRRESAFYEIDFHYSGFEWIDFRDTDNSVISFLRKGKDPGNFLVFVCNFTPVPRYNYRIGVPEGGFYREILNSDSEIYWGSNMGNYGGINADLISWHKWPYSLNLVLPPLSVLIFKKKTY